MKRLAGLALMSGILGSWAWAQLPAPRPPTAELKQLSLEELMAVEVQTVTTASKRPEKSTAAPATVIVIDCREIELRGYRTLKDVLRDLPGMETIEFTFSEFGTLVPVRGISGNNKLVVLVNGMRVNPPGGENFPLRSDFSVRNAERIEVIYGPGSTLYGQDAIAAVINVCTAPPSRAGWSGELAADGGRYYERDAWGSFQSAWGADRQYRLQLHLFYHDSELTPWDREYPEYWAAYRQAAQDASPAGAGAEPVRQDYGLNAFARFEVRDFSLQFWHRQSERSSAEGFDPGLGYLAEAVWGDRSYVLEGRHVLEVRTGLKLETALSYNRYEIAGGSRYVFPTVMAGVTNWFFGDFKAGNGDSWSLEETLRWEVSPVLSVLAGVSLQYQDITPKYTVGGEGFTYYTTLGETGTAVNIPGSVRSTYGTYAGYVEGTWQALERLKVLAGLRLTKDTRFDELPLTPRAALVYELSREWTAKYIFTRAYVAPAPYFANATYDNGQLLATTNPDLEPEIATTHELALSYTRKNFTAGASVYYGEQEDLILISDRAAPSNVLGTVWVGPDADQARTLVRSANAGESDRYGLDLYARGHWGRISPWVSYSYVDFNEEMLGSQPGLPGFSHHNGRAGLTWAPWPQLFVTPSLAIRSRPRNVHTSSLNAELDLPWDLNLHLLYRPTEGLDLFVHVRNVFDHHYALGGVKGAAIPQETLGVVGGLRCRF